MSKSHPCLSWERITTPNLAQVPFDHYQLRTTQRVKHFWSTFAAGGLLTGPIPIFSMETYVWPIFTAGCLLRSQTSHLQRKTYFFANLINEGLLCGQSPYFWRKKTILGKLLPLEACCMVKCPTREEKSKFWIVSCRWRFAARPTSPRWNEIHIFLKTLAAAGLLSCRIPYV